MSISFTFDGKTLSGLPGDTIASALLRSGVRIINRSFKYHRPRGLWGAWVDEPNGIVDVELYGIRTPNCRATTTPLIAGMDVQSVNSMYTAQFDPMAGLDRMAKFIPAAFYYKTFLWPNWNFYEPMIRKMAGLGKLDPSQGFAPIASQRHDHCDLLVVGAGPSGLQAALEASRNGRDVLLVDDRDEPGGSLIDTAGEVDGVPAKQWAEKTVASILENGGRFLRATTAFGAYDHGSFLLAERRDFPNPPALIRVRAGQSIIAAGAIERPLVFPDNDRPGIMSAHAALSYLNRYSVKPGSEVALITTQDPETQVRQLEAAGAKVTVRPAGDNAAGITGVKWRWQQLKGVAMSDGSQIDCDTLLCSGGWTPSVHLHCQTAGKLEWRKDIQAFVPRLGNPAMITVGSAAGTYHLDDARQDASTAARGIIPARRKAEPVPVAWPKPGLKRRAWVDFQNDVTTKDIELAGRENMKAVEHLKRYTTLGMANDQGKLSNMLGLATMASVRQVPIPEVGTTTFRPPFEPVSLASFSGTERGAGFAPVKRLYLENQHRAEGAHLREYGGWLRPAYYTSIDEEIRGAREKVSLFDGSPLGKIDVFGPDAEKFINFVYYNTMSTLKPGRARYGFLLTEGGVIFDDGVLFRLAEDHFSVSCSSSHVDQVTNMLNQWRQDQFDASRVYVQDATANWVTLTLSGPKARDLMRVLDFGISLDDEALPHLSVVEHNGVRIARVSFTGDCSYEISVPSEQAQELWDRITAAGKPFELVLQGVEALAMLRMEKGLIFVGKDTDGTTMPHDLGFAAPRAKKKAEFVGKRSLLTEEASREDRLQLVGLLTESDDPLPVGGHVIGAGRSSSQGYITSSGFSPTLRQPIALALVAGGNQRQDEPVEIYHLGHRSKATVTTACFVDPKWERLNA